jgi:hypothetical protein
MNGIEFDLSWLSRTRLNLCWVLWDVQAERLLKIEDQLRRRVVGQDEAIKVPADPCLKFDVFMNSQGAA